MNEDLYHLYCRESGIDKKDDDNIAGVIFDDVDDDDDDSNDDDDDDNYINLKRKHEKYQDEDDKDLYKVEFYEPDLKLLDEFKKIISAFIEVFRNQENFYHNDIFKTNNKYKRSPSINFSKALFSLHDEVKEETIILMTNITF